MGEIIYPSAGETIVKAQRHHKDQASSRHIPDLPPVADRNIKKRSGNPEYRAGGSCRHSIASDIDIPEPGGDIPADPARKINDQVFDPPDLQFQVPSDHQEHDHIIHQMRKAKMEEHTGKQRAVVPVLQHHRHIHRPMLQHKTPILRHSLKTQEEKDDHICRYEQDCTNWFFRISIYHELIFSLFRTSVNRQPC